MKQKQILLLQRDELLAEVGQLPIDYLERQEYFIQSEFNYRINVLGETLSNCGGWAKKSFYCKKCGDLLKVAKNKFYCEIRYCDNPECQVYRFAKVLEELKTIKAFKGLRTLWHFAISFKAVPLENFKNNFSKYKKRQEYVIMSFFKKLRSEGIDIKGVRVLDFSFVTEGMVVQHFHFGAVPVARSDRLRVMSRMQQVRIKMIEKMKNKTPFHLEIFKHANIQGVLSYFAIRSSGLYKYNATTNPDYKPVKVGNLLESIKAGNYLCLKDIMTKEEYLKTFYGRKHYAVFGGVRHGSTITLNTESKYPNFCNNCGKLEFKDVRIEIEFVDEPPPDESHEF